MRIEYNIISIQRSRPDHLVAALELIRRRSVAEYRLPSVIRRLLQHHRKINLAALGVIDAEDRQHIPRNTALVGECLGNVPCDHALIICDEIKGLNLLPLVGIAGMVINARYGSSNIFCIILPHLLRNIIRSIGITVVKLDILSVFKRYAIILIGDNFGDNRL